MKNKIIAFLSIALIIVSYLLYDCSNVEPKIKETIKVVKTTDTIYKTLPARIEKVYIRVPKIIEKESEAVVHDTVFVKKQVKKYVYKDTLKNGLLTSTIFAEMIYKRNIKLTTADTIKTIEKTIFKPRFYLGGSVDGNKVDGLNSLTINGYLTNKMNLFGVGAGFNLKNQKSIYRFSYARSF